MLGWGVLGCDHVLPTATDMLRYHEQVLISKLWQLSTRRALFLSQLVRHACILQQPGADAAM